MKSNASIDIRDARPITDAFRKEAKVNAITVSIAILDNADHLIIPQSKDSAIFHTSEVAKGDVLASVMLTAPRSEGRGAVKVNWVSFCK